MSVPLGSFLLSVNAAKYRSNINLGHYLAQKKLTKIYSIQGKKKADNGTCVKYSTKLLLYCIFTSNLLRYVYHALSYNYSVVTHSQIHVIVLIETTWQTHSILNKIN